MLPGIELSQGRRFNTRRSLSFTHTPTHTQVKVGWGHTPQTFNPVDPTEQRVFYYRFVSGWPGLREIYTPLPVICLSDSRVQLWVCACARGQARASSFKRFRGHFGEASTHSRPPLLTHPPCVPHRLLCLHRRNARGARRAGDAPALT